MSNIVFPLSYNDNLRKKVEEGKLLNLSDTEYEGVDLLAMPIETLRSLRDDLDDNVSKLSHKLVRLISRQTELEDKINQNCQVVSAIIQGSRLDTIPNLNPF